MLIYTANYGLYCQHEQPYNTISNQLRGTTMSKILSVASWNVEHFKDGNATRVKDMVKFIKGENDGPTEIPDIFALYEVEGKNVFWEFMEQFPDYRFHMTEGKQTQEIFVGYHKKHQAFVTQRVEFKTQRDYQRPGLFLTVRPDGTDTNYSLLFLHVRSGVTPESFGLRDAALEHAFNLKKALDEAAGGGANFIFLGDLNTMGIDDTVPYSKILDFSSDKEIARLTDWCKRRDMLLALKDSPHTWWNGSSGYDRSDLDHVAFSKHMTIRGEGGSDTVSVLGWPKLPDAEVKDWLEKYSDHGLVYFEVW